MPTYQYACTACGEKHEAVQSFTEAPLTECPACGGTLRKVFSAVGVVFKGSGFYKNDSRKSTGEGAGSGKESGKESGKDASKESAKEPAAKTESKSDSGSSSTPTKSDTGNKTPSTPAAKTA